MGAQTEIEWADATINLWWGCTKVSPGCKNCYAERLAHRWGKDCWGPGAPREDHRVKAGELALRLDRKAEREGRTIRVFSASQSDWLDPEVPAEWLADLLALIEVTPHLTWMLLTKRPELWEERMVASLRLPAGATTQEAFALGLRRIMAARWVTGEPPHNVWVGTTVEDQERADQRIPALLEIPARVRFLSCEPLLERVDLADVAGASTDEPGGPRFVLPGIHWVICGGESGPGARPMHPEWARSLRDQCQAAGVPFFFKQWGEWAPPSQVDGLLPLHFSRPWHKFDEDVISGRYGKKAAGRLLDGRTWDEVPA